MRRASKQNGTIVINRNEMVADEFQNLAQMVLYDGDDVDDEPA